MAFGQDFLKAFFGNDYLKDYTHASKTFRTNGYENTPRYKFLFHVFFNINTDSVGTLKNVFGTSEKSTIGLLVKNIELPKFQMDVETLNQYNRKRLVQKKINYNPVRAVFHDDGGDLIRTMWYSYYAYYYKDASQNYYGQNSINGSIGPNANRPVGFSYNNRDIYDGERAVNDWGYIGESYNDGTTTTGGKPPFFRDITVYGFNQHKFVQYTLVNPMITEWNHDTYDYSADNGVMENSMTIQYETVKYYTGAVGAVRPDTNVQGFADPNYYDQQRSSLSRPGGTASIIGQGGLLDAGIGIFEDLQTGSPASLIGAVQKAGATYNTFKGKNIRSIVNAEAVAGVTQVLTNTIPGAVRAQPNGTNSIAQRLQAPLFPTPPKKS
jgi:hypothetical protein